MLKISKWKNWNAVLHIPIILDYLPSDLILESEHPGIVKAVSSDGKLVASACYRENNTYTHDILKSQRQLPRELGTTWFGSGRSLVKMREEVRIVFHH
mmetsp:Transcript_9666/g.13305  ORF Transcript_9666/g.13305 Transcript_9666/m.13305 type:complete len:98 (+) Transcript_9666:246-539(+)